MGPCIKEYRWDVLFLSETRRHNVMGDSVCMGFQGFVEDLQEIVSYFKEGRGLTPRQRISDEFASMKQMKVRCRQIKSKFSYR